MMELLVAILMSLGALTTSGDLNTDYLNGNSDEISRAQEIIDSGQYRINEDTGGVIIDPGVGL